MLALVVNLGGYIFKHILSHVILKFGRSPDMFIAVDWVIKHQHKQKNKSIQVKVLDLLKIGV